MAESDRGARSVEVPGARLWSVGRGRGPGLVMLHGGPGLWDYLGPVAALVEDVATVYRYDQRGCGRSTGDGPYDLATALADLEAVRAAWGVERWTVFGHSWGATLGLAYAVSYPERTNGLVYVSGTGVDPAWHEAYREERLRRLPPAARARWHELRALRQSARGEELRRVSEEHDRLAHATDLADPSRVGALLAWLHADGFPVNVEANRRLSADGARVVEASGMADRLRRLTVPTLVVHGELDPRPVRFAARVAELVPGAELVVMPDVGHFPRFEAPESFAKTLRGFLGRLYSSATTAERAGHDREE
jgi:proline iminopeptidase